MRKIFGLFLIVLTLLAGCFDGGGGGGGGGGGDNGVPDTNADLSNLTLSAGPLDQVFQANQLRYTATVGFLAASTTVTPTTDAASATVEVNGVAVTSGTASGPISLNEGPNNEISVIVTAEDGITNKVYTIGVTRESADSFAQQAYLRAFNAEADDQFGFSVALSGDTLAVGAVGKNFDAGEVYMFTRDNDGVWSQQDLLRAFNAEENDQFGFSVALSGDTLAVGAVGKNIDAGAVYVFTRDNTGDWGDPDLLRVPDAEAEDQFGFSISLSGDTLAVGAVGKNFDADPIGKIINAGAVYVFTRDNTGDWGDPDLLRELDAEAEDQFGFSISLSGDTLAVGAVGKSFDADPIGKIINAGAVYVFTRDNTGDWGDPDLLRELDAEAEDQFGFSISLSGDTLAVGAVGKSIDADLIGKIINAGAVYVFTRDNTGDWGDPDFISASNAEEKDQFGGAVALSGDTLAVGAVGKNFDAGEVYVFIRDNNGDWGDPDLLRAFNAEAGDLFGAPVVLSGDTLAVGAVGKNINAGAVYVFQ